MFRSFWSETSGANRFFMLLIAMFIIGLFVAVLNLGSNTLGSKTAKTAASTTTTTGVQLPENNPFSITDSNNPVTTTLPPTAEQLRLEYPEGNIMDAKQLAYAFNQANSGLTPSSYQRAVEIATRFNLAETTGQGVNDFAEYFSNLPADPWVKNYKVVYVSAKATDNPRLVKALVWFTGIEKTSGLPMTQVQEGFYLGRSSESSLDLKPVMLDAPSKDPQIGVNILS